MICHDETCTVCPVHVICPFLKKRDKLIVVTYIWLKNGCVKNALAEYLRTILINMRPNNKVIVTVSV